MNHYSRDLFFLYLKTGICLHLFQESFDTHPVSSQKTWLFGWINQKNCPTWTVETLNLIKWNIIPGNQIFSVEKNRNKNSILINKFPPPSTPFKESRQWLKGLRKWSFSSKFSFKTKRPRLKDTALRLDNKNNWTSRSPWDLIVPMKTECHEDKILLMLPERLNN